MVRKTFAIMVMLALIFTVAGTAAGSARADQCSPAAGQLLIDAGQYEQAIAEFTCVIAAQPAEVEGYRGRVEAKLLLGRYSDALQDYNLVTALLLPENPDAETEIMAGYSARLASQPDNIPALTGMSFASWYFFHYQAAIQTLNHLLQVQPDNVYGNLLRGSSRLLHGSAKAKGIADLERAIALAPGSPDVHWIVADAYSYGLGDPQRAFTEATLALNGGLHTPRVHAILGSSYNAFGDLSSAALHIKAHIDLVTTELVSKNPLDPDTTDTLELLPGRTYEIPIPAVAGQVISITTSSSDYWDTILVLLAPDGTPILGSDDANFYFAAFDWTAPATGEYRLQVTFFESVITGELQVRRN
jgi:tetratricopeptide (TPR) repeat protein